MVKQFSNASVDNLFKFFFKIVDLGKIFIELFWGIFDIFAAFYLIFFNIFMYFYYLFLFALDRGSETSGPTSYRIRKSSGLIRSKIPKVTISSGPNPIPAMYRVKEATASAITKVAETTVEVTQTTLSPVTSKKSGAKKSIIRPVFEFIGDILITIKNMIFKPFTLLASFFSERLKPVKDGSSSSESGTSYSTKNSGSNRSSGTSLIDEYMKEYKKGRR